MAMVELRRELVPVDGTDFDSICSFETDQHIGIWDFQGEEFILLAKEYTELYISRIPDYRSFEELDDFVYKECGEHITGVSVEAGYSFTLAL